MNSFRRFFYQYQGQYQYFTGIWILMVVIAAFLTFYAALPFDRFLGKLNPILATSLIGFAGLLGLKFLQAKFGIATIWKAGRVKGILQYWWVIIFPLLAIFIDLGAVFSKDTHILFPESVLFYPLMGFIAEIVFHLIPLAGILFLSSLFRKPRGNDQPALPLIFIVALFEPIFQVCFLTSFPLWAIISVGLNLFLFNVTQLIVFKRFGFLFMYSLRLFYYFIWHILWGEIRLEILF